MENIIKQHQKFKKKMKDQRAENIRCLKLFFEFFSPPSLYYKRYIKNSIPKKEGAFVNYDGNYTKRLKFWNSIE